jgi:hypothetical protein
MKSNHTDRHYERYTRDRSYQKSDDDYNILEPSPDIDLSSQEDDDEEISDYTLMEKVRIYDYEE